MQTTKVRCPCEQQPKPPATEHLPCTRMYYHIMSGQVFRVCSPHTPMSYYIVHGTILYAISPLTASFSVFTRLGRIIVVGTPPSLKEISPRTS